MMKTTFDIPDYLYKRANIHAVKTGQNLKDLVITSLDKQLSPQSYGPARGQSFMERRKLLPGYEGPLTAGAYSGGTDSSIIVSEDRSSREDALL